MPLKMAHLKERRQYRSYSWYTNTIFYRRRRNKEKCSPLDPYTCVRAVIKLQVNGVDIFGSSCRLDVAPGTRRQ
jgi:hypothetical protein